MQWTQAQLAEKSGLHRTFIGSVAERLAELLPAAGESRAAVVPPPRALGVFRKACSPVVQAALSAEFDHDWVHLPVHEIERRLKVREPTKTHRA